MCNVWVLSFRKTGVSKQCAWHNAELTTSCGKPRFVSRETSILVECVKQCSGGSLRGSVKPVLLAMR